MSFSMWRERLCNKVYTLQRDMEISPQPFSSQRCSFWHLSRDKQRATQFLGGEWCLSVTTFRSYWKPPPSTNFIISVTTNSSSRLTWWSQHGHYNDLLVCTKKYIDIFFLKKHPETLKYQLCVYSTLHIIILFSCQHFNHQCNNQERLYQRDYLLFGKENIQEHQECFWHILCCLFIKL